MTNQKYITVQGLNQSITDKINIQDRLSLYKAWKKYVIKKYLEGFQENQIRDSYLKMYNKIKSERRYIK